MGGAEGRLARMLTFGALNGQGTQPPRPEQLQLSGIPPAREPTRGGDFFSLGGVIEEADVRRDTKVAKAVNGLYLERSSIEHFADVTPATTPKDLQRYYKIHPDAKLLVAKLGGEIVGAVTIAPEEGLRSAKINRIVRREDKAGLDIGYILGRHARDLCFASPSEGFGVSSITIGVILDVKGSPAPLKLFQKLGFELVRRLKDRCDGYSWEKNKLVPRDVAMMILTREKYESDREIEKLELEEEAKEESAPPTPTREESSTTSK